MSEPVLYKTPEIGNRRLSEVLPDGSWHGHPAFILGGGPSLKDFDFTLLRGRRVIGVNLAFTRLEPTILFSMDTRFLRWVLNGNYGQDALRRFNHTTAYKTWLLTYNATLPGDIFYVPAYHGYMPALKTFTFNSSEGIGHGNNSGFGALNLAVTLGANPIYLLGFDMKHEGAVTHWHNGHPIPQPALHLRNFAAYFAKAAPQIKARGIRVIHLTPSALTCFETGDYREVLC